MASIETLRRRRRIARAKLESRTTEFSTKLDTNPPPSRAQCETYLREIRDLRRKVEEPHAELEESTPDEDLDQEMNYIQEVSSLVLGVELKVDTWYPDRHAVTSGQQVISPQQSAQGQPLNPVAQPSASQPTQQQTQRGIKLPELRLPKFKGDVYDYPTFWDQFRVAVHENPTMDDAQRFVYLRSCLEGVALAAIEGFKVEARHYQAAIDILEKRFGKPRLIVESYISAIIDAEPKSYADVANLSDLRNTLETKVRSLAAIGRDAEKDEIPIAEILIPIFKKKLPPFTRKRWETRVVQDDEEPTITKFFAFLSEEVEIEIAVNAAKGNKKDNVQQSGQGQKRLWQNEHRYPTTTSALHAAQATTRGQCPFCSQASHDRITECATLQQMTPRERNQEAKKHGVCLRCLRPGHMLNNCRSTHTCRTCNRNNHNSLLHLFRDWESTQRQIQPPSGKTTDTRTTTPKTPVQETTSHFVPKRERQTAVRAAPLLQTAKAILVTPNGEKHPVRCLFDTGSQQTFIERKLADDLGLKGRKEKMRLSTLSDAEPQVTTTMAVKFVLVNKKENTTPVTVNALTVKKIRPIHTPTIVPSNFPHLRDLELADDDIQSTENNQTTLKVDVIIGSESYWDFLTTNVRQGTPTAMESIFGWVLSGPSSSSHSLAQIQCFRTSILDEEEDAIWKQFQDLETIGVKDSSEKNEQNDNDQEVFEHFKRTIEHKDGRYHVNIPWKDESALPDNYWVAKKRFMRQEQKLQEDQSKADHYKRAISEYEELGFAEPIDIRCDMLTKPNRVWYLPHSGVFQENRETTKCRVVFDGSSKCNGISLNSKIHTGPALQPNLVGVILRFRRWHVAVMADVQKMFLQIVIKKEDRDAMRYLWRDNPNLPLQVYRFIRVIFGTNVSPFLSMGTIKVHVSRCREKYPDVSKEVDENMYVDDFPTGRHDVESATKFVEDSVAMMAEGGFPLVKFLSNDDRCLDNLPDGYKASVMKQPPSERLGKVLGVPWELHNDSLGIAFSQIKLNANDKYTKRHVLKSMASIFDPMGWVSPFVMQAKNIFRETWKRKKSWDEELCEDLKAKWTKWSNELPLLEIVKVNRCVPVFDADQLELHGFGDASGVGYGSAVYLRYRKDSKFNTQLLLSKSRVAPMKKITLPRLELMAALVNARLTTFVKREMFNGLAVDVYCWTDSRIVLQWINQEHNDQIFVRNRVNEIKALVPTSSWKHVPGKDNPSDRISRGQSLQSLLADKSWWTGPTWLHDWIHEEFNEDSKMQQPCQTKPSTSTSRDRETDDQHDAAAYSTTICDEPKGDHFKHICKLGWIRRFTYNCRNPKTKRKGPLKVEEVRQAVIDWIKSSQQKRFKEEYDNLNSGKNISTSSSVLKLDPFLDQQNILRVGGRLQNAEIPYDQKHQILLPNESEVSRWLIRKTHLDNSHCGTEQVLSELRKNYWIPRARKLVKTVLFRCQPCRKVNAQAMQQKMGILPRERVNISKPFTNTGVDFAGPLYVKAGKQMNKVYVCLFTCMSSRAVHLELVSSLGTEVFLMALRRMIARRGKCEIIWSDNAMTFKTADQEIQAAAKAFRKETDRSLTSQGIKWKFIPERAPWWGGMYERLVRSIKTGLQKVLQNAKVNTEELATILVEVECQVNSRPLTVVSSNPNEPEPVTPAHLLIGCPLKSSDVYQVTGTSSTQPSIKDRWRYRQRLATHFWNRWSTEYLINLQQRSKWFTAEKNAQVNDVVLVQDDRMKRGNWPLGIIKSVTTGRDGLVRSAVVKTTKGEVRRPIQRLYLVEAFEEDPAGENVENTKET